MRERRRWCYGAIVGCICWSLIGCGGSAVDGGPSGGIGTGASTSAGTPSSVGGSGAVSGGAAVSGGDTMSGGIANGGSKGGADGVDDCYSPGRNLDRVFEPGAHGCACDETQAIEACIVSVLVLRCISGGHWQLIEDEACHSYATYSSESCAAIGGIAVPNPGNAASSAEACASGLAIGRIEAASDSDGLGFCCSADPGPDLEGCGGFALHSCSAVAYCAYAEGQSCGRADAASYCKPRPTACEEIAAPVCGCDDKTYDNACFAHRAGTGIYSSGPCQHPTTP